MVELIIIACLLFIFMLGLCIYIDKFKKKIDEGVNTLLEIKELMKKDVAKKPQTTWICPKCKTVNDGYAPKCKCGFEKNW